MTLLVGVTGSDGIALGTDRKVMRGGETYFSDKIHIVQDVAFATEGYTGIAEDFLLLLEQEITRKKGFDSLYEAKTVAEDVIAELGQRYSRRLGDSTIGLIMAGLENIKKGPAKCTTFTQRDMARSLDFGALVLAADTPIPLRNSCRTKTNRLKKTPAEWLSLFIGLARM